MQNKQINEVKGESYLASAWREFRKNRSAVLGIVVLALIVILAVGADMIAPYDPFEQNYSQALQWPSMEHFFGTDEFGRDIFTRVLYGARISLLVGVVSVTIACVFGSLLGASAGYFSGTYDAVVMRCMDVLLAIPSLLLNISIISALGAGVFNMMLAVGISNIPRYCRIMRASVLQIKNMEYVEAARTAGGLGWADYRPAHYSQLSGSDYRSGHAERGFRHYRVRRPELYWSGHLGSHA